jgi:hypothetical protein
MTWDFMEINRNLWVCGRDGLLRALLESVSLIGHEYSGQVWCEFRDLRPYVVNFLAEAIMDGRSHEIPIPVAQAVSPTVHRHSGSESLWQVRVICAASTAGMVPCRTNPTAPHG